MKYSLSLGRLAGIQIFVHWTFALLLLWIIIKAVNDGLGVAHVLWSVAFVLSIFACVVLHEMGHALMAKKYKVKTRDITLLPIGGIARLESIPEKPIEEMFVALAGPAVNFAIVLLLYPVVYYTTDVTEIQELYVINSKNFLLNFVNVNFVLGIFNMIPAFPMDGGRVLRALLSFKYDRAIATRIAATLGQVLAICFVFIGFFSNPFLIFIGLFIFLGAQAESIYTQARSLLKGFKVKDVIMKEFHTLATGDNVKSVVDMILNGQSKNFLVMDDGKPVGTVGMEEVIKALREKGEETRLDAIMSRDVLILNPEMPLEDVSSKMERFKKEVMPVVQNEKIIGTLDSENIMEFIMIRYAKLENVPW